MLASAEAFEGPPSAQELSCHTGVTLLCHSLGTAAAPACSGEAEAPSGTVWDKHEVQPKPSRVMSPAQLWVRPEAETRQRTCKQIRGTFLAVAEFYQFLMKLISGTKDEP